MQNRVLAIALGAAFVVGVPALYFVLRQPPDAPETVTTRAAPSAPRRTPRASAPSAPSPDTASRQPDDTEAPPAAAAEPSAPPAADAPPAAVNVFRVDADVPGAQVFIDRQFIGAAPVTAENVTPGSHQLNVSAEGFESVVRTIDVAPGDSGIVVKLREVRLDSTVEVVHRHGIGSCRGRLVATPRGLRYDTTNKDDAFTTGLVDLETFEVDYLAKNLRVKLPKGRQFNFTDPEGNADRLFVFHRDVGKARDRLKRGDPPAAD